jgi:hypothetical protein
MKRGENLQAFNQNPEHQRRAALARTRDPNFLKHNQQIAPDGPAASMAYHRARTGKALIDHWHSEFLFLDDYAKSLDQTQHYSECQRRWLHGWHVWNAIWGGLNAPPRPTQEEFAERMERTQTLVSNGLPLQDPLDVIFVAPDDYCGQDGEPLSPKKQRKAYRHAMERARAEAESWSARVALQRTEHSTPRQPGKRRKPSTSSRPRFLRNPPLQRKYQHRYRIT